MIRQLHPYTTYKDSRAVWLKKVPVEWEVRRLKSIARNINEQTSAVEATTQHLLLTLEHVEGWSGKIRLPSGRPFEGQGKRFLANDILFGKLRPYLAKVTRPQKPGICVTEFLVLRPENGIEPAYLERLLRSYNLIDLINSSTYGAKMPRVEWDFIGSISLPLPPLPEQRAIVKFLDWADRRIWGIIAARKKRIQLLEEYRQTLINDAVTGKFDVRTGKPYPAYKDSGVEWLGKVPEGWEVRRLKSVASITMGQSPTSGKYLTEPQALPFLQGCAEFGEKHPTPKQFHTSPTKIARSKSILLSVRAPVGRLNWADRAYGIGRGLAALAPCKGQVHPNFLWYYLQSKGSEELQTTSTGSTYDAVSYSDIGNLSVLFPPLPEQRAIAEYLDRETKKIDAAIEKTKKSIELWEELRTTLIADVVTGKLDVREVAEKLPEEEPELEAKIEALEASLNENGRGAEAEEPEPDPAEEPA